MKLPLQTGWAAIKTANMNREFRLYDTETGETLTPTNASILASDTDPSRVGLKPKPTEVLILPMGQVERVLRQFGGLQGDIRIGEWLVTRYGLGSDRLDYLVFYAYTGPLSIQCEMVTCIGGPEDWRKVAAETVAILEGGER